MSRERSLRIEALFQRAADLPLASRDAFLIAQTAGDDELLLEIRSLLAEHDRGASGLLAIEPASSRPSAGSADDVTIDDRFRMLRVLGEGGLGVVWLAEQLRPLRRQVAIKFIKPGMDSRQVIARFEAERQALALMDHAGIAHVHDAGLTPDGRPYFVMEYVAGSPLCAFADAERLTTRERLEIFLQVCEAVHHAHRKGIVHRDLKPTNIVVARVDDRIVAKVIDFGIAKAMTTPLSPRSIVTMEGQAIGTPAYMSPEQSRGEAIDSTTDVYSLGVTLYQLLTDALPFDLVPVHRAGSTNTTRRDDDDRAVTPSSRIVALGDTCAERAALRRTDWRRLARTLRGDVDWIVMKAIEAEPERRYASAHELGADIRRYLDGEPVRAGPPGLRREVARFVRRHRVFVGVLVSAFIALSIGIAVAISDARHESALRETAERDGYRSRIIAAAAAIGSGEVSIARRELQDAPSRFRDWEWRHLAWKCDRSQTTISASSDRVPLLVTGTNSDRVVASDSAGRIVIRDGIGDERVLGEPRILADVLRLSADGRFAVIAGKPMSVESEPGSHAACVLALWDLTTATENWRLDGAPTIPDHPFAIGDSEIGLTASDPSRLMFFATANGEELRRIALEPSHTRSLLGIVEDLAIFCGDDGARAVEHATGNTVWRRDERSLTLGRLDSGRRYVLYSGLRNQHARIVDVRTGAVLDAPSRIDALHDAKPRDTGGTIALQSDGAELVLVDSVTEEELVRLPGHDGSSIEHAWFFADGKRIISLSDAHEWKSWSAELSPLPFRVERGGFGRDAHAATGRCAFSTWGLLEVWDADSGSVVWCRMLRRGFNVNAATFSPSGREIVVDAGRGALLRLDANDGREISRLVDLPADAVFIEWLPDEQAVLVAGVDGVVYLCDVNEPRIMAALETDRRVVTALAVRGDGGLVAIGTKLADGASSADSETHRSDLRLWDLHGGAIVRTTTQGETKAAISGLAFDSDGERLAIGFRDGTCEILDIELGRVATTIRREHAVSAVRFMGRGRLAIGYSDAHVHVHDVDRGDFLLALEIASDRLDFDRDRLVTTGASAPVGLAECTVPVHGDHARAIAARARSIVDALPRAMLLADDVERELAKFDLPDEVHREAVRYAGFRDENANELNSEAWSIARNNDRAAAEYQSALRLAERANEVWPDDWAILNTIAVLELRLERPERAIELANRSNALLVAAGREQHPANLLIRAVASWRLSDPDAARADLVAARELTAKEPYASDPDTEVLLQEAIAVVSP